jgi:hypothetical protein
MKTNKRSVIQIAAVSAAAVALGSGADVSAGQAANSKETSFEHVQLRTTRKHGVELALSKSQRAAVTLRFAGGARDQPGEQLSVALAGSFF